MCEARAQARVRATITRVLRKRTRRLAPDRAERHAGIEHKVFNNRSSPRTEHIRSASSAGGVDRHCSFETTLAAPDCRLLVTVEVRAAICLRSMFGAIAAIPLATPSTALNG